MAKLIQATKAYYLTVEGFLTSNLLLLNLRCVTGHIVRERDIYNFNSELYFYEKNIGMCGDTLMDGHWEKLIGKVEKLFYTTDDLDNYYMHVQYIIQFSSDNLQHLKSFLRLHAIK